MPAKRNPKKGASGTTTKKGGSVKKKTTSRSRSRTLKRVKSLPVQGKYPLTPKQEAACRLYLETGDKSAAYRGAYNCAKMKPTTVNVKANELFANGKVAVRVAELEAELAKRNELTVDRIIQGYMNIAFTDLPDVVGYEAGVMTLKDFKALTAAQRACIKEFKVKSDERVMQNGSVYTTYVEVKLYSKIDALRDLGRHLKMFTDKVEHSGDHEFLEAMRIANERREAQDKK